MKNPQLYLKQLLRKSLNETLEGKLKSLKSQMDEIYGDMPGMGDNTPKFDRHSYKKANLKDLTRDMDLDSTTEDEFDYRFNTRDIDLDDELYGDDDFDFFTREDDDIEPISEGEMCEQCGSGSISEGECNECGYKRMEEGIYDVSGKFPKKQSFDYVEEEDDLEFDFEEEESDLPSDEEILARHCKSTDPEDIKICKDRTEMLKENLNEKLHGKQNKLDKNRNGKIDAGDFKLLRKNKKGKAEVEEEEVEEGNEFSGALAKAKKEGKKTFKVDGKEYPVKESIEYHIEDNDGDIIKLSENELVNFVENIVNEQKKEGLKTIGKAKGLSVYEKAHKGSGKENQDYLKSVSKKMKDYLKDGSKGKYDMNPKMFPAGNGELAKMDKKAFQMTDELEDFNYEIAGQNFPVPDAIDYNEEWMEKLFKGDSMTGNAPGGNALESKTNERFNKMRKKNTLKKLKDQSYARVPSPVYNEKPGSEVGEGLKLKLESSETKKTKILNEEFDRMKELLGYNRKTQ